MRIIGAKVVDYTFLHQRNEGAPVLFVKTDASGEPRVNLRDRVWHEDLLHVTYEGKPFYQIRFMNGELAPIHSLNTAKGDDGTPALPEPMVGVVTYHGTDDLASILRLPVRLGESNRVPAFGVSLRRAKDVLRRYAKDYHMEVDAQAARRGEIIWVPVENNPKCLIREGRHRCGRSATQPHFGRPNGVCDQHRARLDRALAEQRVTKGIKS